jgi:protein-disulfide isomerase
MTAFSRRALLSAASTLGLAAWSASLPTSWPALAQQAGAVTYKAEDLAVAGPLGDKILGNALAPVTMIEYASMTCSHCANFHQNGFKFLKERYIDTGKVRYILREFPSDPLAAAGFMLAHCGGEGRFFPVVDLIFSQQAAWIRSERPVDALLAIVKQAGFTQESFETCLRNQTLYDGVQAARQRGLEKFAVDSTPTFFINGRKVTGALAPQELEKIIEPLLKS